MTTYPDPVKNPTHDLNTHGTAGERTPNYYRGAHNLQPFDVIDAFGLDFYSGNVCKYLLRYQATHKIKDLEKAVHYLEEFISRQITAMERAEPA